MDNSGEKHLYMHFYRFSLKNIVFFSVPHNSKTIYRTSKKIAMQLHYENALGFCKSFLNILIFRRFLLFYRKNIAFLVPHNSETICHTSMKFYMQLHHGNALGC